MPTIRIATRGSAQASTQSEHVARQLRARGFDAELLATGDIFPHQAFRIGTRAYGLQFHPEVTPEVFQRWIREASHMLAESGAHSGERQVRDAERFDQPLADWLARFMDSWLVEKA